MKSVKKGIFLTLFLLLFLLPQPVAKAYTEDFSTPENKNESQGGFRFQEIDDGTIKITGYTGTDTDIVIPDTIDGKIVSVIGYSSFQYDHIASVTIPGSVTHIEEDAFYRCDELETVTFTDDGLESIGDNAFYNCEALQELSFPTTLENVGEGAFSYVRLENLTIPSSVEKWGDGVFFRSTISTLIIEDGITKLGKNMFYYSEIDTVKIPSSVTNINNAFEGAEIKSFVCQQGSAAYKYALKNKFKITYKGPYINITQKSVYIGDHVNLKLKKVKSKVKWKSSNKAIATVSSKGVVTTKKKGTVTISTKYDGITYSCKIKVKNMSLSSKKTSLVRGELDRLKLTGSKGKKVIWKSSNPSVVVVSKNGYIKGKRVGKAQITAKCKGITYKCYVTVKKNQCNYETNSQYAQYGDVYVLPKHAEYDGSTLAVQFVIINNTSNNIVSLSGNFCVYNNNSLIGEKTFSDLKVNVAGYSRKTCTIKISSNKLKEKNLNLTTGDVTAFIKDGQYFYYYYRY
ncbi:leucine-rich repeat protein [Anaerosporobacter sp.]